VSDPWNKSGISTFAAGLLAIALVVGALALAFGGVPLRGGYELNAVFADTANVGLRSPVRIAGVEVGEVTGVEAVSDDSTASVVTMELDDSALPIRDDAQLKVRPRIFLEGNFFVDLEPGTPQGRELDSGDTIPITQTAAPVQIDQVLGVFQTDAREDLQTLIQGYGEAISGAPTAAEDASQDPSVRGLTAAQAGNQALRYAPGALRGLAVLNQSLLGTEPGDLARLIRGSADVSRQLVRSERQLQDLIVNFDTTMAAFAARQSDLSATVRALPRLLETANPALDALNASFPPTRAFAREVLPGVDQTAATIDAAFPWVRQMRPLVSPAELQGLVGVLQPATADLAQSVNGTVSLLPQIDGVDRCLLDVILPTGDVVIQDPPLTTGVPNYKEFFQTMVGLAGESQNFDGNGPYTRFQPGGGAYTVSTGALPGIGPLYGNAVAPPIGTRPARPSRKPPYNRDAACHRQQPPNLNAARTGAGP